MRGVQPSGASPRGWSSASPEPGGAGATLLIRPASPSSTSRTLERARSTWGQLFQGVTGAGVRLPMEHAPVTCMSRPGARGPRSQGPASHPAFRASALPPQIRSARLSVWREVVGVSMRHGEAGGDKFAAASTFHRLPSGLTGGPIRLSDSHRPSGQAGGRAEGRRGGDAALPQPPAPIHPHENGPLMRQRPALLSQLFQCLTAPY